jgi:hypothetical protein
MTAFAFGKRSSLLAPRPIAKTADARAVCAQVKVFRVSSLFHSPAGEGSSPLREDVKIATARE